MPAAKQQILDQIGDPREIAKRLRKFRHAANVLSSDRPRLINKYPNKWIVVFDGKVRAAVNSFDAAMAKAKALNLPKANFFVRYIAKKRQTMIFRAVCRKDALGTRAPRLILRGNSSFRGWVSRALFPSSSIPAPIRR